MATTFGIRTLTYPDEGDRVWYGTWVSLMQSVTASMDEIAGDTSLSEDSSPQLGGNMNVSTYDIVDANANELVGFSSAASAVNSVSIVNNGIGSAPQITAAGDDINIDLNFAAKGTGSVVATTGVKLGSGFEVTGNNIVDANDNELATFGETASAVNNVFVTNSSTGNACTIEVEGGDTNVDLNLTAKGTGNIKCPTGLVLGSTLTVDTDNTYDLGDATNAVEQIYLKNLTFDGGTTDFTQEDFVHAWVNYDQQTPLIVNSYNVSSVTDSSTGFYIVNFSASFDNAAYTAAGGQGINTSGGTAIWHTSRNLSTSQAAGSYYACTLYTTSTASNLPYDSASNFLLFVGDRG